MTRSRWTLADLPDLTGKRIVVTGPTAGLGTATARELARAGAEVVLVARSHGKLDDVRRSLEADVPTARFVPVIADLSDLGSVRKGADEVAALGPLDVLVNNAGVMALPYARTVDGFELQLATNHFGPFLLTGMLLPRLAESGDGRVVVVASQAHRLARRAPLEDPRTLHGRYSKWGAYGGSKLANLLFAFELDRRAKAAGLPVKALAAHPGYSATELVGKTGGVGGQIMHAATRLLGQPAHLGALPTLMAATADLPGSTYVGPDGLGQMRGYPRIVKARRRAYDADAQRQLWDLSEQATGIRYP
ncbi:MAG: SDR family NAD(P)-dependent oxidoreductase [Nocardioidaceae bacterium]|nr:SDR family NAD(P)-dependent oxidoreductase [Nocardioidaceae bacterium]